MRLVISKQLYFKITHVSKLNSELPITQVSKLNSKLQITQVSKLNSEFQITPVSKLNSKLQKLKSKLFVGKTIRHPGQKFGSQVVTKHVAEGFDELISNFGRVFDKRKSDQKEPLHECAGVALNGQQHSNHQKTIQPDA